MAKEEKPAAEKVYLCDPKSGAKLVPLPGGRVIGGAILTMIQAHKELVISDAKGQAVMRLKAE